MWRANVVGVPGFNSVAADMVPMMRENASVALDRSRDTRQVLIRVKFEFVRLDQCERTGSPGSIGSTRAGRPDHPDSSSMNSLGTLVNELGLSGLLD